MNLSFLQPESAVSPDQPDARDPRLRGRWLVLSRGVWLALVILTLGIFFASLPVYMAQLQTPCAGTACAYQQLSPGQGGALKGIGLSIGAYAAYTVALTLASVVLCLVVSTLIVWRRSDDRIALLVALLLVTYGPLIATSSVSVSPSPWRVPNECLYFLALALLVLVFLLFPTGQFVPHWMRWTLVVFLAGLVPTAFVAPSIPHTPVERLTYLVSLGELATLAIVQLYRYRRVSSPMQRQQTKWVVFGIAVPITFYVSGSVLSLIFPALADLSSPYGSHYQLAFTLVYPFFLLFIPLSFGFAMLRYYLFEIDIIINRTLVYGALTISIIGIYILIVGSFSTLFQSSGNLVISLVATGLVAVLFQPLRERFQLAANRFIYGERDDPYAVLSRLGRRLEATLAPDAVLPTIVETVAQALKLPYAAITLKQGDEHTTVASYGASREELVHFPLVYQTEPVGELLLAPRIAGEHFTPGDRRLLDDLARQVGIAAHTIRLTADLQQLAGELQASRIQLVTAREEERRRLRRDLHDGLGSSLTSATFQLDAACNLLGRDLNSARTLLKDLKTQMQASIADIRRLVYNLRPPILDEWGLAAALREQVAQYQLNSVHVIVDAPESLPALPAAIEVVAYRIALEALANVIRHAQATTCTMRLVLVDNALTLEVLDDGKGLLADYHAGVGICAMRERAAELGGSCTVDSSAGAGTRVYARLPFPKE